MASEEQMRDKHVAAAKEALAKALEALPEDDRATAKEMAAELAEAAFTMEMIMRRSGFSMVSRPGLMAVVALGAAAEVNRHANAYADEGDAADKEKMH